MPPARTKQVSKRVEVAYKEAQIVQQEPEEQEEKFPCTFAGCYKLLSRKADVARHEEIHDPNTKKRFKCSVEGCSFGARQQINRNKHMLKRHQGLKYVKKPNEEERHLLEMASRRYLLELALRPTQTSKPCKTATSSHPGPSQIHVFESVSTTPYPIQQSFLNNTVEAASPIQSTSQTHVFESAPSTSYHTQQSSWSNTVKPESYSPAASSSQSFFPEKSESPFDYYSLPFSSSTPDNTSYVSYPSAESTYPSPMHNVNNNFTTPSPLSSSCPSMKYTAESYNSCDSTYIHSIEDIIPATFPFDTSLYNSVAGYNLSGHLDATTCEPAFDSTLPYQIYQAISGDSLEFNEPRTLFTDNYNSDQLVNIGYYSESMINYQEGLGCLAFGFQPKYLDGLLTAPFQDDYIFPSTNY